MIFLIAFLILFPIYLGVGGYTFFSACGKWKQLDFLDEAQLQGTIFASSYSYIRAAHDWLLASGARDVWTQSEEGLKLHAQWLPAENPRGTILLVHGYHSTPWADFGRTVQMYNALGINLLIPDQRCHGQSEGRYVTFGVKECRDMLCWIAYHNRELSRQKVIVSGVSMGAATVMYLTDEHLPDNVVGFIEDCGYTSPAEIVGKVFQDITHLPPVPWIWATELCARIFGGFSLREKDACRSLAKNSRPILFVHGTDDALVPCEMGRRAYAESAGEKDLLLVEGATHAMSYPVAEALYSEKIRQILKKTLGEQQ